MTLHRRSMMLFDVIVSRNGIRQCELARIFNIRQSVVETSLIYIAENIAPLSEDDNGNIAVFEG